MKNNFFPTQKNDEIWVNLNMFFGCSNLGPMFQVLRYRIIIFPLNEAKINIFHPKYIENYVFFKQ